MLNPTGLASKACAQFATACPEDAPWTRQSLRLQTLAPGEGCPCSTLNHLHPQTGPSLMLILSPWADCGPVTALLRAAASRQSSCSSLGRAQRPIP